MIKVRVQNQTPVSVGLSKSAPVKVGIGTVVATGKGGIDVSGASVGQIIKIAAVDNDGKPTAWEPADLPELVQANWNSNDRTAADYVRNRTHYEEVSYVDYVCSSSPNEITGVVFPDVGETITVKVDGVETEVVVQEQKSEILGISYKYVGTIDLDSSINGGTGWVLCPAGPECIAISNSNATISIKTNVVHKIDNKFINFDGFVRTFESYFQGTSQFGIRYDDYGNTCCLYTCKNFVFPEAGDMLFGYMGILGFSLIGSVGMASCFVQGFTISGGIDGTSGISSFNSVLGTDKADIEFTAAGYGFTHRTKPNT